MRKAGHFIVFKNGLRLQPYHVVGYSKDGLEEFCRIFTTTTTYAVSENIDELDDIFHGLWEEENDLG